MKASELIADLQRQIEAHGDAEVWQAAPETAQVDGTEYHDGGGHFTDPAIVLTGYQGG